MIFLIGGAGFVGSAFARVLAASGREFAVIERDNYADFVGCHCEILINANGNSSKLLADAAPAQDFEESVTSVRRTLADFSSGLYIYLSSCDVYPDCSSPATTAEDAAIDVECQSAYGFHKYVAEQCVRHATPEWLVIRMGGLVGPGLKKNAIYDILHGAQLWLDAESELQFLHCDFVAAAVMRLADDGARREIFNLCGKGVVKLRDAMEWAGREIQAKPGSPKVRYEACVDKVARYVTVPESSVRVREFIEAERGTR